MLNNDMDEIKRLGNELIRISDIKKQIYPFRKEYIDRLIEKLNKSNEKYIIHLLDLPDEFIVRFNENGIKILIDIYSFLKNKYKLSRIYRRHKINFYLLHYILVSKTQEGLSIKTLKSYIKFFKQNNLNILDIAELEKTIIAIGPKGNANLMCVKKLPLDLSKEEWAYIFGVILDSYIKRFKFVSEDEKFAYEIKKSLDKVGIKPFYSKSKKMFHIFGHSVIGNLISIAGLDTSKRQILANNAIPLWIINNTTKRYQAILLSKFLDTEGSSPSNKNIISITQSSHLPLEKEGFDFILSNSKKTTIKPSGADSYVILFSKLNQKLKEKVLSNPPLILISMQILLRKHKINSKIYPQNVYVSSNNLASICWHLNIQNYKNIKRFYELCKEFITVHYKKQKIKECIERQKIVHIPPNLRFLYYLVNINKIQHTKHYFISRNLIDTTKRGEKDVANTIGNLSSLGFIQQTGKEGRFKKWVISENGESYLKEYNINKKEFDYLLG